MKPVSKAVGGSRVIVSANSAALTYIQTDREHQHVDALPPHCDQREHPRLWPVIGSRARTQAKKPRCSRHGASEEKIQP